MTYEPEVYVLVRRNPTTRQLERIRFDSGIVKAMSITPDEWKPLDGPIEDALRR